MKTDENPEQPATAKTEPVVTAASVVPLSFEQVLFYEVSASWWACWIGIGWLQDFAAAYYGWKTKRKFARYQRSLRWHAKYSQSR